MSTKAIPVVQLDKKTGVVIAKFNSAYHAAEHLGLAGGAGNINRVANGKAKSAYGFAWRFEGANEGANGDPNNEEWRQYGDVEVSTHGRIKRATAGGHFVVRDVENYATDIPVATINGKPWQLHRLVAHVFLDIPDDPSIIVKLKDGNPKNVSVDNIVAVEKKRSADHMSKPNPKAPRPVQQWTHDGQVMLNQYDSVSAAAKSLGLEVSYICKAASGKERRAGGFIWKYASA